jgi:hypothetical protein
MLYIMSLMLLTVILVPTVLVCCYWFVLSLIFYPYYIRFTPADNTLLSPDNMMSMDQLRDFIKLSERVIIPSVSTLIADLRAILRNARTWKIRFDRSNYADSNANKEEISALLEESKTLPVDLSEFTENLSVLTKTYCLCRQLYFGDMVSLRLSVYE